MAQTKVTSVVPIGDDDATQHTPPTQSKPDAAPVQKVISEKVISMPKFFGQDKPSKFLVKLGMKRASTFGLLSALVLIGGLLWCGVRWYLMVDGENRVSEVAFRKLATSIGNTVKSQVERDLIYQDMIANSWAAKPDMSRQHFRKLVMSEAYAPGLRTMTGISLIPRILGAAERKALEDNSDSERLRAACCAGTDTDLVGSSCATVAATGLFCESGGEQRYQVTQFGEGGVLLPAVANTTEYIERVGAEEYMVVDMIEPFASNAKVWGFNLLSSQTRNLAWRSAMATGQKTFTRRLNLVQSTSKEYGFLVWLPVFAKADGEWTTALNGDVTGLTAVGSVNGVYRAQHLLTEALESTYTESQLEGITVYLFDNAEELGGQAQFLAVHGSTLADPYTQLSDVTISDVEGMLLEQDNLHIESADAKWVVVVAASDTYLSNRRTSNAWLALVINIVMLIAGAIERWLGHPALFVEYMKNSQNYQDFQMIV